MKTLLLISLIAFCLADWQDGYYPIFDGAAEWGGVRDWEVYPMIMLNDDDIST